MRGQPEESEEEWLERQKDAVSQRAREENLLRRKWLIVSKTTKRSRERRSEKTIPELGEVEVTGDGWGVGWQVREKPCWNGQVSRTKQRCP